MKRFSKLDVNASNTTPPVMNAYPNHAEAAADADLVDDIASAEENTITPSTKSKTDEISRELKARPTNSHSKNIVGTAFPPKQ